MKDERESSLMDKIAAGFGSLSPILQFLVLLGAAVAVLVAFFRWIRPRIKSVGSDMRAIRDTLVGRPALHDSITDRIIPGTALPSIGDRMASQEVAMAEIAESLSKLADATDRLTSLENRMTRVEGFLTDERLLGKIESVQMLRTIETVAQAEPGPRSPDGQVVSAYPETDERKTT